MKTYLHTSPIVVKITQGEIIESHKKQIPDFPLRLALSNFEHLVSLSSEHRNTQTDRQLKALSGALSKL